MSFEQAVAVDPLGEGRYTAVVDPAWDGPAVPNGGVLAAILVRAAQTELGSEAPAPRAIAAHYLAAPSHGPVELAVEVLRSGRSVAVCEVRMSAQERLICQLTLVCSAPREPQNGLSTAPPAAPAYEQLQVLDVPVVRGVVPTFLSQLELRQTFGPPIFSGAENAITGGWMAFRGDDAPLDAARVCALCDLWWPAIYGSRTSPAAATTLQLTVYLRTTSSGVRGPVLARFETRNVREGHLEERGELWSHDGQLLAESHQLALLGPAGPG